MDKISIIIPVYNVEQYIRKCLDSVINQTHSNLEIICINDGSTDNSGKICDEYSKKDNRIIVFHQLNQGISKARNLGLRNFTGQYIGFVDPDDWIEPDMYEILYNLIKSKDVFIGIINYYQDTDNECTRMNINELPEILTKEDMLKCLFESGYGGFRGAIWNKLLKAELFKSSKLEFATDLKMGRDMLFFVSAVLADVNCTGACNDKPLYHYCIRDSSITYSTPIHKRKDMLIARQRIIDSLKNKGYGHISMLAKRHYCYCASLYAEEALCSKDEFSLEMMKNEINIYLKEYLELNEKYPDRIVRINNILNSKIGI